MVNEMIGSQEYLEEMGDAISKAFKSAKSTIIINYAGGGSTFFTDVNKAPFDYELISWVLKIKHGEQKYTIPINKIACIQTK